MSLAQPAQLLLPAPLLLERSKELHRLVLQVGQAQTLEPSLS